MFQKRIFKLKCFQLKNVSKSTKLKSSLKWADRQTAVGRPEFDEHDFDHPFLQTVGMFLGEFTCLITFQIYRTYLRLVVLTSYATKFGNLIGLFTQRRKSVLSSEFDPG